MNTLGTHTPPFIHQNTKNLYQVQIYICKQNTEPSTVQFRTLLAFCFQHDPLPNASSQAASQPKMFQILVSHLTLCTVQTLQFVQLSGRINVFSSLDFFRCKQQVRLGTLVCSDICETSKTGKNSKTKENS